MPVLTYGNYTHPDYPAVSIRKERKANPDGTKPYDHITWQIRGLLSGYSSQSNLLSAIAALRAGYASNGQNLTLKQSSSGATLESLTSSSTFRGTMVTQPPALPQGEGPELASLCHYEIQVEADAPATGSLSSYDEEETVSYALDERHRNVVTTRGRLRTPAGTSAEALFAAKDPGAPGAAYHLAGSSKQLDADDTSLEYSYVYQEGQIAWPTGVYSPVVTESLEQDKDGKVIRVIQATMSGPNAESQLRALQRPDLRLESRSVAYSRYDGTWQASFRYLDTSASRELVAWSHALSYERGGLDFVMHTACDGGPPVRQNTVIRPWRVTEEGTAVGHTRYPAMPPPIWPAALHAGGRENRSIAKGNRDEYTVTWSRTYEFPTDPGLRVPSIPDTSWRDPGFPPRK